MSNSYNVVLTGELLKGQSIMQAANSLSKLFKIAPIQAQQMLARAPLVIKKNLEEDTAVRFVQAMYKSGFGAAIEEQKTVKTTVLLHPFSTHYDDEDEDEEPALNSITPVLVEQSRLEESLDTELSIPVTAPAAIVEIISSEQSVLADNNSAQYTASITPEIQLSANQLPQSSEFTLKGTSALGKSVTEPSGAALEENNQFSISGVEENPAPAYANSIDLNIVELDAQAEINPLPDEALLDPTTVLINEASSVAAPIIASEISLVSGASSDAQRSCDSFVKANSQISVNGIFADENKASANEIAVTTSDTTGSESIENTVAEDLPSAVEPTVETQVVIDPRTLDAAIEPVFTSDESLKLALNLPLAESEEIVIEDTELEDAVVDIESGVFAETELESAVELEDQALIADAYEHAAVEDKAVVEADLTDLQWVEPVAQWQTVAELAEENELEQPHVHAVSTSALSRVSTDAVMGYGEGSSASDFIDRSVDLTHFEEKPAHWDESVEITQALTDRLAQIAEESKEINIDGQDPPDESSAVLIELEPEPDINAAAEGVLLFEEADVTEISAADWDDWHPVESAIAETSKRIFNPLLDFDEVEPDWKNSAVELSFDAAGSNATRFHHSGLTAENEQELEAFLECADTEEGDDSENPVDDSLTHGSHADEASYGNYNDDNVLRAVSSGVPKEFTQVEPVIAQPQETSKNDWAYEISVQANCGFLEVTIPQGKELHVAAAASVTMGLSLHEQLQAGSGVRVWLLAKGFVLNTYEAIESAGNVGITAITHGMVCAIDASDFPVIVQQNAYLASTDEVQLNADQSRLNPVVSACKWIHCSGTGELWLNAQGLWEMVEVDGCYRINSRYLMAFSKSLELKAPPLAGLKSYLTSGGGVECRLTGRGVVWVQTDASRAPVLWQKAD